MPLLFPVSSFASRPVLHNSSGLEPDASTSKSDVVTIKLKWVMSKIYRLRTLSIVANFQRRCEVSLSDDVFASFADLHIFQPLSIIILGKAFSHNSLQKRRLRSGGQDTVGIGLKLEVSESSKSNCHLGCYMGLSLTFLVTSSTLWNCLLSTAVPLRRQNMEVQGLFFCFFLLWIPLYLPYVSKPSKDHDCFLFIVLLPTVVK